MNGEQAAIEVDVHVGEGLSLPFGETALEEVVRGVFQAEGRRAGEISLAFVSDPQISSLNQQYLGHSGPTDVISFPLDRPDGNPLGDVYIGLEQASRQAQELGVPLEEEVLRLVVHGVLHVLGYDHPEGEERYESEMYRRQEELLASARRALESYG